MSKGTRYIFVLSSLLFLVPLFSAQADTRDWFQDTWQCNTNVDVKDCQFTSFDSNSSYGAQSYQLYSADTTTNYNGHDNDSTARVDVCISEAAQMWTGVCQVMFQRQGVKGSASGSAFLQIGSGDLGDYNIVNMHVRVNDADTTTVLRFAYRRVSIDSFTAGPSPVKVGDTITVNWGTSWALGGAGDPVTLSRSGAAGTGSTAVAPSDSKTFTAQSAGTATFTLKACGPGDNGSICIDSDPITVTVESVPGGQPSLPGATPLPGPFNLSGSCTGNTTANLSWTTSSDATSYRVERRIWTTGVWQVVGTTSATSFSEGTSGTEDVYYRVFAVNSTGQTLSTPSELFVCGGTGAPPPPPPPPPGEVTLTVTTIGSGAITSNDGKINCGANSTCSANYPENATPELTATANPGWAFSSWSGECGTVIGNTCYMSMTRDKSVTATFSQVTATRTLTVNKSGSGTVTSDPAGISCGTTCSANFGLNSIVTLTAIPGPGLGVTWSSGCDVIQGNVCSVTMSAHRTVTVAFAVGTGTISIVSKEVNTGNPVNTDWSLFYGGSIVNQETGISSKTYTNKPAGQYDLQVLLTGTTHTFDHFDINPANQFLNSGQTLSYTVWYRLKTAQPQTCQDPKATNFGGSLPCTYLPGGTCQDSSATNFGEPLPCTYPPGAGKASASCTVTVNPPPQPAVSLSANPSTIIWNQSSTLSWSSSNVNSCSASGDWSGSKNTSGSESTGNLTQIRTYNYTLSCSGPGGTQSANAGVTVNAPVPTASNVTVTEPNYCFSGPAATVSWTYSDPTGSPQTAYQVQIDDQGSFNSPEVDSGKINSGSNSYFTGQGALQFNVTYRARVRVWNSYNQVSDWTTGSSWKTPPYAYPQVNFTWSPTNPALSQPVQFTDQTVFNGSPNGRRWSWLFGDGGSSTQQNPPHTYKNEGTYYVTLTATDNANQSCAITRGPISVQKPIPIWKEVAPR